MDPAKCKAAIQDAYENFMKVVAQQEDHLRQTLDHAKEQSRKAEEERKYWEAQNHKAEEKAREADTRLQLVEDILQEVKQMRVAKESSSTRPEIIVLEPAKAQPVAPTQAEPQVHRDTWAPKTQEIPPQRSEPSPHDGPAVSKSGANFKAPPVALSSDPPQPGRSSEPPQAKAIKKQPPPSAPGPPPGLQGGSQAPQAMPKEEMSRPEFGAGPRAKLPPPSAPLEPKAGGCNVQDNWFSNSGPSDHDREMARKGYPPAKAPPSMPCDTPGGRGVTSNGPGPPPKAPTSAAPSGFGYDPKPSGPPPHKPPPTAKRQEARPDPPDLPASF